MLGTFVLSAGYYDDYYTRAQKVRKLLKINIDNIFSEYDALLLPASPVSAFKAGEKMDDPIAMYLADIYTVMANLMGVPAISLHLYKNSNGMPFGLQLMKKRFDELTLLQISHQMMQMNRNNN
jgi:aspartyl-tRNA(Asn)/glutamyl-tRNA(Gln) amidotransferase subunit A